MFAGSQYTMNFHVQGWRRIAYASDLELDLSELPRGTEAELRILNRLADGARLEGLARTKRTAYHSTFRLRSSSLESALRRMPLQTSDDSQARLMITLPETAPDGVYNLAILQRIDGREMGRVTQRLVVGDHPYVGNRHTHELHVAGCEWVGRMNPTNRVAHREIEWPLRQGYNGCHYCLPEYDDD